LTKKISSISSNKRKSGGFSVKEFAPARDEVLRLMERDTYSRFKLKVRKTREFADKAFATTQLQDPTHMSLEEFRTWANNNPGVFQVRIYYLKQLFALFVCLLVCLFVPLFVCLFVRFLACLFVCLFVWLFVGLLVCLFVRFLACLFGCWLVCKVLCLFRRRIDGYICWPNVPPMLGIAVSVCRHESICAPINHLATLAYWIMDGYYDDWII
jgi:lipopolysaccharide export LptBFGC system permease protein LptF